jgi:hypothetical protein
MMALVDPQVVMPEGLVDPWAPNGKGGGKGRFNLIL